MTATFDRGDIEGLGLALRSRHYGELLAGASEVPWLEVLVDTTPTATAFPS